MCRAEEILTATALNLKFVFDPDLFFWNCSQPLQNAQTQFSFSLFLSSLVCMCFFPSFSFSLISFLLFPYIALQTNRYKAVKLKWQKHYHSIAHKHTFTTLQNTILAWVQNIVPMTATIPHKIIFSLNGRIFDLFVNNQFIIFKKFFLTILTNENILMLWQRSQQHLLNNYKSLQGI